MAKTLQLQFINEENKIVSLSVDHPLEPVDPIAINAAMDSVLLTNVFTSAGGDFVQKKGARIVERNIEEVVL